jgi:translation initiation factor IF-3
VKISNIDLMINDEIHAKEVRLIGSDGEQLGVFPTPQALAFAEDKELDLVLIAPNGEPPVCKIMDYGKYRFELIKREKEQRKNQKIVELKEVRLSATIDRHDLEIKAKNCEKFLKAGDKVKVSIRFKGRQASHSEFGMDVMKEFLEIVKDSCVIDRPAKLEGRNLFMILAPKR